MLYVSAVTCYRYQTGLNGNVDRGALRSHERRLDAARPFDAEIVRQPDAFKAQYGRSLFERRSAANTNPNGEHQIPSWIRSRGMSIERKDVQIIRRNSLRKIDF
jgi:hypothetical protein